LRCCLWPNAKRARAEQRQLNSLKIQYCNPKKSLNKHETEQKKRNWIHSRFTIVIPISH
jgi:hypothetical protein